MFKNELKMFVKIKKKLSLLDLNQVNKERRSERMDIF